MTGRPSAYTVPVDEHDARRIEELVARVEDGFNRKDAATLDGPFTRDAVVTVPDGTTLRGWDDLFAYHTARLAGPVNDWNTRMSVLDVRPLSPGVAVAHVRQDTTTPDRTFGNRALLVVVEKDGTWWICAMQNTTVAPG